MSDILKTVEGITAEADELLRGQIRRELLRELECMALPVAHDILILLARARNVAALAVQITEPEVPERERIVQIERASQRLQCFVLAISSRRDHTQQQMRARLERAHFQHGI